MSDTLDEIAAHIHLCLIAIEEHALLGEDDPIMKLVHMAVESICGRGEELPLDEYRSILEAAADSAGWDSRMGRYGLWSEAKGVLRAYYGALAMAEGE